MSRQLQQMEMTREEAEALQREGSRLDRILEASNMFVRPSVEPPVPNSPMKQANKADLREAYDMSYLLLFSAEDHLRTILMILKTGPLPCFALLTLIRAAADADVHCRHLLEPLITETERLARGLNERLDNLKEQRKGDDPQADKHFKDRVDHLEQRAKANGITPLYSKGGGAIHAFGEPMKTDRDLFAQYLPGGAGSTAFSFLSGYVHSKPWVTVQASRAKPSAEPGIADVATDLNVLLFTAILKIVLDIHDFNIGQWLRLAGYPPEVWANAKKGPAAS
jgi:hypothetical protein